MQKKLESLPTIGSLLDETFLVEKYQRGYKWDSEQVRQLLEDIHQFYCDKTSSFYCLQPIIVTKTLYRGEKVWEVIDGQQRLTTTFLILKTLENKTFSLHYSTRERSRDFLENIANCISGINYLDVNQDQRKWIRLSN